MLPRLEQSDWLRLPIAWQLPPNSARPMSLSYALTCHSVSSFGTREESQLPFYKKGFYCPVKPIYLFHN